MPGKLGTCPTCKREISTSAKFCPNCGETDFLTFAEEGPKETYVDTCGHCGGIGKIEKDDAFFKVTCEQCEGSGKVNLTRQKTMNIDLRTGEKSMRGFHTSTKPLPSGCVIVLVFFLMKIVLCVLLVTVSTRVM